MSFKGGKHKCFFGGRGIVFWAIMHIADKLSTWACLLACYKPVVSLGLLSPSCLLGLLSPSCQLGSLIQRCQLAASAFYLPAVYLGLLSPTDCNLPLVCLDLFSSDSRCLLAQFSSRCFLFCNSKICKLRKNMRTICRPLFSNKECSAGTICRCVLKYILAAGY